MQFKDIIGQDEVKRLLRTQVEEGRIPHAQLLCGPEGCGKLGLAIAYASYLLCQHPHDGESCGTCPACVKTRLLAHPDLHFVFPIIKKKGSSREVVCDNYIGSWRQFVQQSPYFNLNQWMEYLEAENQQPQIYTGESDEIQRKLNLKSSEGGCKILILWLPEKMNLQGANKLLKILEEPPRDTYFLLVSEQPDTLLDTIQSRTQRIPCRAIPQQQLMQSLMEHNGLTAEDARQVAHMAGGNYLKAMETIHIHRDTQLFFDHFTQLMRLCYQRKVKDLLAWSEEVASWGRERQKNFLTYSQRLVRENFVYNLRRPELNYLSREEEGFSQRFARFITRSNVMGMAAEMDSAARDIEQNVNPKMVFFDFTLKMTVLLK